MKAKREFSWLAVFVVTLAFSLICSTDAVAQGYNGDGATQLPGLAGGTVPAWSPTTGGWDVSLSWPNQCLSCHNSSGGSVGAHDKSSYLMTGHKNVLRKVSPSNPWAGADGLPYATLDSGGNYIYGSGSTYDWLNGNVTVGSASGLPDAYGPGVNVISGNQDSNGNYLYFSTTRPLYYLTGGWADKTQTDATFQNGFTGEQYPNGNYDCARCHTTGYRFDDTGVEPTDSLGNHIPTANFSRVPSDYDPASGHASSWQLDGVQCESCHSPVRGDHYSNYPLNQNVTLLCLQCHRGETVDTVNHTINPGNGLTGSAYSYLLVSDHGSSCSDPTKPNYASCIAAGQTWKYKPVLEHEAGPTFLNSPHARFSGTITQNTQNSPDLSVAVNGTYNSQFSPNPGDASQNNGCSACHDVHQSLTQASATPLKKQCSDCHALSQTILTDTPHPTGPGTPFPTGTSADIPGSCVICHMVAADGHPRSHLLRISTDPNYSTFPTAAQLHDPTNPQITPNTASDGILPNASWQDVDLACGQCHVGGTGSGNPYGLTPPSSGIRPLSKTVLANAAVGQFSDWHHAIHSTDPLTAYPTFTPTPGVYYTPQSVTLSDAMSGAIIHYTLDGSTPTLSSPQYIAPIAVSANTTINAIATAPGYMTSIVGGGSYTFQTGPPTFSPSAGSYTTSQSVTLTDVTSGALIYYTTDGSTPTTASTPYGGAIPVPTNTTIKAIASGPAGLSTVTTGSYTFPPAPLPTSTPSSYQTFYAPVSVTLQDTAPNVTIYYTTDGSTPTIASTAYTGPILVSTTKTINFIAANNGYGPSLVASATYSVLQPPDLIESSVTGPTTGTAGGSISVSDTTKNQGSGAAIASYTMFYLSTDGKTKGSMLTYRSVPALAAGASSSAITGMTLPANVTGTIYVLVCANGSNSPIVETDTTNDCTPSAAFTVAGADLIESSVTGPTSGAAGGTISVSDTTKNQGGGTASASYTMFYLSTDGKTKGSMLTYRSVAALAAGASSSATTSMTLPANTIGTNYVLVCANNSNSPIAETDTTNDCTPSAAFTVAGADLIESSVTGPSSGTAGGTISVSDTTKNQGGGAASASYTMFYLSTDGKTKGSMLTYRSVAALAAGASSSATSGMTLPTNTIGTAYVLVCANNSNSPIPEADTTNDCTPSAAFMVTQ